MLSSRTSLAALVVAGLAGCVETLPPLDETTSLDVQLLAPTDLGAPDRRLGPLPSVQIQVTAIDAQNQPDTSVTRPLKVYVQYLGTLTPELGNGELATIMMIDGMTAPATIDLPPLFGPAVIWVEDSGRPDSSFATGTSPTLWFRDPYVSDISTPESETALDALISSPLDNKQVTVTGSRHVGGHLVVTGTYAQGYTISDVLCADAAGTPPCTAGNYDHILIFSFSRPKDEKGRTLEAGQFIEGFAGGVQEFNGLTEIGFPQTFNKVENVVVDPARIPAPVVVQPSWLTNPIEFERREAGLIEVDNATVCDPDADTDYVTYKQWKLDIGSGCRASINVVTSGVVDFDPHGHVGMQVPKVVGILRPLNLGTGNIWIMYPRSAADLTL